MRSGKGILSLSLFLKILNQPPVEGGETMMENLLNIRYGRYDGHGGHSR